MINLELPFRWATPDDADDLARFINMAGEGLPYYLWQQMADDGVSPWAVGRARAKRDSGGFSYRNSVLRMLGSDAVACLVGYSLPDAPQATHYADLPPMFVPLQQLEDLVPGTWYINVVATSEGHRGKGYGRELLALAETIARDLGKRGLSLILADTNESARELYLRLGYRDVARRPMVKEQWQHPGLDWVLMVKELVRAGSDQGQRPAE